MPTPVIELNNVTAGYYGQPVLRAVSLTVREGAAVGIIGPNGHGKTTLLRAISALIPISEGDVLVDGQSMKGAAGHVAAERGITHIPQGDHIFPDMTVGENLSVGAFLKPSHVRNERLQEVFSLFPRLDERRDQLASTLSGGERRMLALGRGMMHDGRVFMIDEPSLGLAPIVVDLIYGIIQGLRQSGKTILIVEENISRIIDIVDQIYLIDHGEIAATGPPQEMMKQEAIMQTYFGS
jgi:branched-chain amino acid transport system ATP-binding protein